MLTYLLFKTASLVMPALPVSLAYGLGWLAGEVAFHLAAGPRRGITSNLRRVLGPEASAEQLTAAVRGVFHTAVYNYIDMFRIPHLPPAELEKRVDIQNADAFLQTNAQGKSIIIATCHLGNTDLLIQISAAWGIPVTVLVEQLTPPQLLDLVLKLRGSQGLTFLPATPKALREIVRTLKAGGVVTVAGDRDIQHRGLLVPFFGEEARMPTGPIELALRTGAAIIPIFGLRLPNRRYRITIESALALDTAGPEDAALARNLSKLVRVMERHIGEHPEQWTVFEPLWDDAAPPPGEQHPREAAPAGAHR